MRIPQRPSKQMCTTTSSNASDHATSTPVRWTIITAVVREHAHAFIGWFYGLSVNWKSLLAYWCNVIYVSVCLRHMQRGEQCPITHSYGILIEKPKNGATPKHILVDELVDGVTGVMHSLHVLHMWWNGANKTNTHHKYGGVIDCNFSKQILRGKKRLLCFQSVRFGRASQCSRANVMLEHIINQARASE